MHIYGSYEFNIDEELSDIELDFKKYYINNPDMRLDQPHHFSESGQMIHDITSRLEGLQDISDTLIESHFFDKNRNAKFSPHIRYFPAITHRHTFFEVCYLLKGRCKNYTGTQAIEMIPGDILIIAPNTEHTISAFTDDCIIINLLLRTDTFEQSFFNLLNEKDTLATFFSRALSDNRSNTFLLFKTGADNVIQYNFINAYNHSLEYSRFKDQLVTALIQTFFIQLLLRHEKDIVIYDDNGSATDENIIFILRFIQEHYQSLTLPNLSKFFGYSERHMRRLLQSHTGMGFSDLVQDLRMQQALTLLKDPDMTVSNISETIGYPDVCHFRRLFKRNFGVTPVQYRNEHYPTV